MRYIPLSSIITTECEFNANKRIFSQRRNTEKEILFIHISPSDAAATNQDTLTMVIPLGVLVAALSLIVVVLLVIIGKLTIGQRKAKKEIPGTIVIHTVTSFCQFITVLLHNTHSNMHRYHT